MGLKGEITIVVARTGLDPETWFDLPKRVGGAVAVLDPDGARYLIGAITEAIGQVEDAKREA